MRILITGENEFTGGRLDIGRYYNAEPADTGTEAQNKTFHALLQCYWVSGCHSYNVKNIKDFKLVIKLYLGAGVEEFTNFIDENGFPCEGYPDYRIKSWRDYSKKERQMAIDNLINEMIQAGVNSRKFNEILQGLQGVKKQ